MRPCSITTLLLAIISSILTGICGVFPVLLIRPSNKSSFDTKILNRWLSFATGSLVGDVFLHLLPETWLHSEGKSMHFPLSSGCALPWGVGLIGGIVIFLCVEKISSLYEESLRIQASPSVQHNGLIIGYLNLAANATDNFTHGLSIGVSYLASNKCGLLTTSCILIHEVPHEIADFVILLRSGFTRWTAVKAQLLTASTCLMGTLSVLLVSSDSKDAPTVLPFTAGGFLYIALVSLLPSLIREKCPRESSIQLLLMSLGVGTMHALSSLPA
nr:unnamed protein product [Spirometra erinaceieuropaei]